VLKNLLSGGLLIRFRVVNFAQNLLRTSKRFRVNLQVGWIVQQEKTALDAPGLE
jgi:hypothetical protein